MESPRLHLHDLFPFWTPNTPDLGCFVRQKHGLETYDFHVYESPRRGKSAAGRSASSLTRPTSA